MQNFLRQRPFFSLLLIVGIPLFIIHVFPRVYFIGLLGGDPKSAAERIVRRNLHAKDCYHIVDIDIWMGPSIGEKKARCVRHYAELTKDPKACEVLISRGDVGSCLSAARKSPDLCHFFMNKTIRGKGNKIEATLQECISGTEEQRNDPCCIIYRISTHKSESNCSVLQESNDLYNQCNYELALNDKDNLSCRNIQNENLRFACEVRVKALLQKN